MEKASQNRTVEAPNIFKTNRREDRIIIFKTEKQKKNKNG
jgi:hypothetical protein